MCGVSGTRETHWRRRRQRVGRGGVDGSRIELGEVWRGRWRERRREGWIKMERGRCGWEEEFR